MKKENTIYLFITLIFIIILVMSYKILKNRNLNCETFQNTREVQICKSIEKNQEFGLFGHAIISIGYKSTFTTVQKSWCDLNVNESDLETLKTMQYDIKHPFQLSVGAGFLYSLLNVKINPNSAGANNVYSPASTQYLLKDGCK